jgi:CheY-like chemotaxis protein
MQRHSSHKLAVRPLPPIPPPRERALVLCIDDEMFGLTSRKLILEQNGYSVLTSTDGELGLKIFSAMPVQLVVLDYAMPGLDGMRVAEAMRKVKPDVPIIMLSSYSEPPEGCAVLVDAYVVKSEGPEILLSRIHQFLS